MTRPVPSGPAVWLAPALAVFTAVAVLAGPLDMVPREGETACVKPATATARSEPRSR